MGFAQEGGAFKPSAHLGRAGLLARMLPQVMDRRMERGVEPFEGRQAQARDAMGMRPQRLELNKTVGEQR